jgi:hypothetical protein
MPSWETSLSGLSRRAVAAFAARAARRVAPLVATAAGPYGPEAWEWLHATAATIRTVETFAAGRPVSRFTLDLAAELPRAAANAVAAAARRGGPSPAVELAEVAFAVAAFAADAARADLPQRAARLAAQAATTAAAGPYPITDPMTSDLAALAESGNDPAEGTLGRLWPAGEPEGWSDVWAKLSSVAAGLPGLIVFPKD